MGKLIVLSGRELVKIFSKIGWREVRRNSSHIILVKHGEIVTLSIPDHKEGARGTLRSLIRSAALTIDEFNKAL